jgi:peptidoglycan LD-endopeptidase CwlK
MVEGGLIVDSAMEFAGAVLGTAAPREIVETLQLLPVRYCGFDGRLHEGQLVIHRDLAAEVRELFALMAAVIFPLRQAVPIVRYGWSDEASMARDNTSAFNYRLVAGTDRLSRHAEGRALDINPRQNPALYPDGRVAPAGAVYRPGDPGVLADDHPVVRAFLERGWSWGGRFDHIRDYHHFEKIPA